MNALKRDITDTYAKGKINEQHYNNLKDEISRHYQNIYKNKIYSLNGKSDGSNNGVQWDKIKSDIADAYAAGKISEQHYNLLKDTISDYKNNKWDWHLSSNAIGSVYMASLIMILPL